MPDSRQSLSQRQRRGGGWAVEGPADHYAGVTDREAAPLRGAGGGSSSSAAPRRRLGGGGRRLGGLGGVEEQQLKYLARREQDRR